MKVFIGGARCIDHLMPQAQEKMFSIYQKRFDVLVGDCYGIDTCVQKFYADLGYDRVTVYASNGKARNNLGHWRVKTINVCGNVNGFRFYKQKDIAMANDADYGMMVWDGMSRGTMSNIVTMSKLKKTVLVFLTPQNQRIIINGDEDLKKLLNMVPQKSSQNRYC